MNKKEASDDPRVILEELEGSMKMLILVGRIIEWSEYVAFIVTLTLLCFGTSFLVLLLATGGWIVFCELTKKIIVYVRESIEAQVTEALRDYWV